MTIENKGKSDAEATPEPAASRAATPSVPRVTVPGYPPTDWLERKEPDEERVNETAPRESDAARSSVSSLDGVALDYEVPRVKNPVVRSADAIQQQICERLSDDEQLDASGVLVSVSDGEVILEGAVSDRPSMQRAEHIARSVDGVTEVYNRVEVEKSVLAELGDRLFGNGADTQNHSGSGTKNAPNVRV